jgi:hypothetical protein
MSDINDKLLFNNLIDLNRVSRIQYGELLDELLDELRACHGLEGQHVLRDLPNLRNFCEDYLGYLLRTEQHKTAQHFAYAFLLPRAIMNSTLVWMVYKAFRADPATTAGIRKTLPLFVGHRLSELSDSGVHISDIIEFCSLPDCASRFDWVILAKKCRDELNRMLRSFPQCLPEHIWTVIKATWILIDADAGDAVQNLRKQDGYGYAKNVNALKLAVSAIYNFGPISSAMCPRDVPRV